MIKPSTPIQVLLFLSVARSVHADFDPDLFCTLIANNTRIKDPTACNKFVTCIDQKPLTSTCEGNLFYDRNLQSCVDPTTVKCYSSNPCAVQPKVNGFVPDPYACNGYYYCQDDKGIQGRCSPGMNFSPTTKNCIRNYPCEQQILPEDYCNIVADNIFIKVPTSCVSYQVCWHGKLTNGSCPDGFYFNAFKGECDYMTDGVCEGINATIPTKPAASVQCYQPDVFVSDGVSCNGYYYCKGLEDGNIELVRGVCPFFRFFDASNGGACVVRFNTVCQLNRCITFGYSNIQLANVYNDGCTGFLICQDGEIIGQYQCPQGQYFSELLQLCIKKQVKYPACNRSTAIKLSKS